DVDHSPKESRGMTKVVGVRFKKAGKVYYFDPGDLSLEKGTEVVVETSRGVEIGEVVSRPKDVPDDDIAQPLRKVIRAAGHDDLSQHQETRSREKEAFTVCLERIQKHALPMK